MNFAAGTLTNQTTAITLNGSGISNAGALIFSTTGDVVNNPITLASATTIGGSVVGTVGGLISGSNALTIAGTGTLILSNGSNSYSGGTTINNGATLEGNAASGTPLGTAALVFNGGTFIAGAAETALNNTYTVNNTGGTIGGSNAVTLSGNTTANGLTGTLTISNTASYCATRHPKWYRRHYPNRWYVNHER